MSSPVNLNCVKRTRGADGPSGSRETENLSPTSELLRCTESIDEEGSVDHVKKRRRKQYGHSDAMPPPAASASSSSACSVLRPSFLDPSANEIFIFLLLRRTHERLKKNQELQPSPTYIEDTQTEVIEDELKALFTIKLRSKCTEWMRDLTESYEFDPIILESAINIFDRYYTKKKMQWIEGRRSELQLTAVVSCWIASKVHGRPECPALKVHECVIACGDDGLAPTFSSVQLLAHERLILQTLNDEVWIVTVEELVEHLLEVIPDAVLRQEIGGITSSLLLATVTEYEMLAFGIDCRAVSALACAFDQIQEYSFEKWETDMLAYKGSEGSEGADATIDAMIQCKVPKLISLYKKHGLS